MLSSEVFKSISCVLVCRLHRPQKPVAGGLDFLRTAPELPPALTQWQFPQCVCCAVSDMVLQYLGDGLNIKLLVCMCASIFCVACEITFIQLYCLMKGNSLKVGVNQIHQKKKAFMYAIYKGTYFALKSQEHLVHEPLFSNTNLERPSFLQYTSHLFLWD